MGMWPSSSSPLSVLRRHAVPSARLEENALVGSPLKSCEKEWLTCFFWNMAVEAKDWVSIKKDDPKIKEMDWIFDSYHFGEMVKADLILEEGDLYYPTLALFQKVGLL